MNWKTIGVILLSFVGSSYIVVILQSLRVTSNALAQQERNEEFQQHPSATTDHRRRRAMDGIGRSIVNRAYQKTFSILESCPDDESLWSCIKSLRMNHTSPMEHDEGHKTNVVLHNNRSYNESWPWWFKTMLRDASYPPLHGGFHHLFLPDPPMEICVIEKIGTKQWRIIVCDVNGMIGQQIDICNIKDPNNRHKNLQIPNASKIVFLRDPLERFLSAFLDKCTTVNRRVETHCEPLPNFQMQSKVYEENEFIGEFHNNYRTLFEAYVDSIPLKWNLHFLPESLFCNGLFRTLPTYDYVGYFGPHFYDQLEEMADRFGTRAKSNFTKVVHQTFEIEKHRNANHAHVGVETAAAANVYQYYTPKTVRRVLEYLSIDYVKLNFPIPTWAEEMLQQDEDYVFQ